MIVPRRRALGDWFDPSCTPGDPGCVPHWYCYIPGMVTPDCFASFTEGVQESAQAVTGAVANVAGAAVKGAATGITAAIPQVAPSGSQWLIFAGAGALALAVLFSRRG